MKELVTLNINASSQGNEKLMQMARHVSFLSDCSPNAPSCAEGNPLRTRRAEIACLTVCEFSQTVRRSNGDVGQVGVDTDGREGSAGRRRGSDNQMRNNFEFLHIVKRSSV
jgi:hypothetical protein